MIHSAADILQILAADPVIASSLQLSTVDKGMPPLKGEGAWLYVSSYPEVADDFATWNIWLIDFDGDLMTSLVARRIKKLLPTVEKLKKEAGFLRYKTSWVVSDSTVIKPAKAPSEAVSEALPSAFTAQLEQALEKLQDQVLVKPKAGRSGKQGPPGPVGSRGPAGPAGKDAKGGDIEIEDLSDVKVDGALKKGNVLMWDGTRWINRFVPQAGSSVGGGGGGKGLEHWTETEDGHLLPNGPDQNLGSLGQPVSELYITGQTVYLDGMPLSLNASNRLSFDGNQLGYGDDITDAPSDGRMYGRLNGEWHQTAIGTDGGAACTAERHYTEDGGAACTVEWNISNPGFPQAPDDGQIYGRQNGEWVVVTAGSAGSALFFSADGGDIIEGQPVPATLCGTDGGEITV